MAVTSTIEQPGRGREHHASGAATGHIRAPPLWALAFATPSRAFVIYPIGYGLWLASDPGELSRRSVIRSICARW